MKGRSAQLKAVEPDQWIDLVQGQILSIGARATGGWSREIITLGWSCGIGVRREVSEWMRERG